MRIKFSQYLFPDTNVFNIVNENDGGKKYIHNDLVSRFNNLYIRKMSYIPKDYFKKINAYYYTDEHFEIINPSIISSFKGDAWSFENEIRYILYDTSSDIEKDDYFLDIRQNILNKLEITCGPCCSTKQIKEIEEIVRKYCPQAKISESELKIRSKENN